MKFAIVLLGAAVVAAQEDHSQHQHGVAGLGSVNFENSCNAAAQTPFKRGVALLHSFGYEESRRSFEEAAKADPACGIAHWGIAMTWYHPIWAPPSAEEYKKGTEACQKAILTNAKTKREQDFMLALGVFYHASAMPHPERVKAYEKAMAKVQQNSPKDDEAAIFHALSVIAVGYLDPTDKTYAWQKKGAEILNQVLPRNQNHPGVAHYIIHALDYPSTAELGLKAARAYAKIAPDSSHAQHMPSHIFTRLGLWEDSIASNIAAANAAVAQAKRLHGGGGAFDQLHAMDYLVYAYLQEGKDNSARKVLDEMATITKLDDNQFAAAYAFAASPARWALERHDWKAAAALELKPAWFPWSRFRNVEALALFARAIGASRSGNVAVAKKAVDQITAIRKELPATRDYDWSGAIGAQWEAASALIDYAQGKKRQAIAALRKAADNEDAVDKHPVTPGALLPVREILGDLLMETSDAAGALKEYEAVLKVAPRRFNTLAAASKAADKTGDKQKARAYAEQLLEVTKNAEVQRPELIWAKEYTAR
jgi:tetratricopeptide (TPR) repeat protein